LSTKLTCIAAGAFGLALPQFLPALMVGRAVRFAALTVILRFAGERLAKRLTAGRGKGEKGGGGC
jgi:membrane protein YqaA with SNARE-associated domain